jgi:hypothetical protein
MSSGGGGQEQVTNDPWAGQQPYLNRLFADAERQLTSVGPQYFKKPTVAAVPPETEMAQQMALEYAQGGAQGIADSAMAGNRNLIERGGDPANDPFFHSAVSGAIRPVVQQFTEAGGPLASIRSGAVDTGQYGGSRQGIAEGLSMDRLQQNILDTAGRMGSDAYGRGLDAQARGIALAPQTQATGAFPAQLTDAVGTQKRMIEQDFINAAIDKWNWQQNAPAMKLQQFQQFVGGGSYGGTTTSPSPQTNPALAGLGGAVAGATIGAKMGTGANPGYGTAIGAGIGFLIGYFGGGG